MEILTSAMTTDKNTTNRKPKLNARTLVPCEDGPTGPNAGGGNRPRPLVLELFQHKYDKVLAIIVWKHELD